MVRFPRSSGIARPGRLGVHMRRAETIDLGGLLRRLRLRRGLTQEELAELIPDGLSVETVSNIERGRVRPRRFTLLALLDILEPEDAERDAALHAWRQSRRASDGEPRWPGLPVPATPLIGRDRELATLARILGDPAVRLLSLTGPGGVGKTRLALAAAAAAEALFADGAFFIDLALRPDPDQVLTAIARGLGLTDMGDLPVAEQLSAYLRPRRLLLLLDNCEAVVAAGPQIARLVDRCPTLTVLATSREAWRLRCEQEHRVAPLDLPSPDETANPVALELVPAVSFFSERARLVAPDFAITPGNAATVAGICRRLDGLPLAIELAAARLRHFDLGTLQARLEPALDLLVGGPRDLPERQRTLRATLDWSHGLLAAAERQVLRRVSVFADGFTEAAAACVCDLSVGASAGASPADMLAALIDKNLLKAAPQPAAIAPTAPRYGMLETIREYAQERLIESGEAAAVRDRHALHFCGLAEASFAPLYSGARGTWMATLSVEASNLQAALAWCLGADGDADTGLRLAGALGRFWYFTGRLNQGRAWLATALASAPGRRPTPARARALYSAAKLAWALGDFATAARHAEDGLALAATVDDERARGEHLTLVGYTRMAIGQPERALAALRESQTIFDAVDDAWQQAFAAVMASEPLTFLGEYDAASRQLDEALSQFGQAGDRWGEAVAHVMTANLLWRRGKASDVAPHLARADAIFQAMGEKYGQSRLRLLHGYLSLARGDQAEARRLFREGLSLARELGQTAYILLILGGCAAVALGSGRVVQAAQLYGRAAVLLEAAAPHVDDGAAAARAAYAQHLPLLRERLAEGDLAAAWSAGQALPIEDALDLARSVVDDAEEAT